MASEHTPTVEFVIEACPSSDFETDNGADLNELGRLHNTIKQPNGIKRNQRCWDFPNWRLHRAAADNAGLQELKECVRLGATVNSKDLKGRTALHEAAKAGNLDAAGYLLSQGADINASDDNGSTPLLEAVRFNHNDLATFLLDERRRIDKAPTTHAKRNDQEVGPAINSPFWIILQAFMNWGKMMMARKNDMFKWLIIVMNVGLELCQAVMTEEAGDGEIGGNLYRDLTLGFSSICLVLSMVEFGYEAKKNGAKWRKRRGRYCFYYPGFHGRVFGSFTLWFGLISSTVQFGLNTVALVVKRAVVKFDYLALLLAVCLLLAAIMQGGNEMKKMDGAVKCVVHGECEAEGGFNKQGTWVFYCPHCHIDKEFV